MKRNRQGFRQSLIYLLDTLCYAYYCKADNLVSDQTFDEIESLYCVLTGDTEAPNRGNEGSRLAYSQGVQVVYQLLKERRLESKKKLMVDENRPQPEQGKTIIEGAK